MFKHMFAEIIASMWEIVQRYAPANRVVMIHVAEKLANARRAARIDWEKETK